MLKVFAVKRRRDCDGICGKRLAGVYRQEERRAILWRVGRQKAEHYLGNRREEKKEGGREGGVSRPLLLPFEAWHRIFRGACLGPQPQGEL